MSDQDFREIKPEEEEVKEEIEKVDQSQTEVEETKKNDDDDYEKVCFICRRPESVTGKMIDLPNNISVCPDCMQKSFDTMANTPMDLSQLTNMPGIQF